MTATRIAALIVLAVLVALVVDASFGVALGHDEAAYGLRARHVLDGGETTGAPAYRSVGMVALAAPAVLVGGSDLAFRGVAVLVNALSLLLLWRAGRSLAGRVPAAIAIAALATSWVLFRRGNELLTDLPSAALLAMATALTAQVLERLDADRPASWSLLGVAPLAAAAFYIRYGSILYLPILAAVALLLWRRRVRLALPAIAASALLFLVLLLPHVLESMRAFGTPWGLLLHAREAHAHAYPGRGFLLYLWKLPELGAFLPVLIVAGAAAALRTWNDLSRPLRLALVTSLGHLFIIGLRGYAEPRYVFVDIFLLAILGGLWLEGWLRARSRRARRLVVAFFVANALTCLAVNLEITRRRDLDRRVLVAAGQRIRQRSGGAPCVLFTSRLPQMTWYTGCHSVHSKKFDDRRARALRDRRIFWLFIDEDRDPPAAIRERARRWANVPPERIPSPGPVVGDALLLERHPAAQKR